MDHSSGLSSLFDDWSCSVDEIDEWILSPDHPFVFAGLDEIMHGPTPSDPGAGVHQTAYSDGLPTCDGGSYASKKPMGYSLDDFLRAGKLQERIDKCTSNRQPTTDIDDSNNNNQTYYVTTTEGQSRQLKVKRQRNVVSESKRRKQLTRLFYTLRCLLPVEIPPQNNRCWVIDETCAYIRDLQKELQHLKLKKDSILLTNKSRKLDRNGCLGGVKKDDTNDVRDEQSMGLVPQNLYVRVTCVEQRGVKIILGCHERGSSRSFSTILNFLETKGFDIMSANRSQAQDVVLYAIHARHSSSITPNIEELEKSLSIAIASNL